MFSKDLLPSIHYSSYDAWKKLPFPLSEKDDPVISAFREQSLRVSVGVRALIERAIEENYNMILDGVHMVPGFIDLKAYADDAQIFLLIVTVPDKKIYHQRFESRRLLSPRRPYDKYLANFNSIIKIQDFLMGIAENYNCPVISNIDFEKTVITIIELASEFLLEKEKNPELLL
jgi:2-phosphoglycerate kinase